MARKNELATNNALDGVVNIPSTEATDLALKFGDFTQYKTTHLVRYVANKYKETEKAFKGFVVRTKELYPALMELEIRYNKQPGKRTDLDDVDFGAMGWHQYLESVGVKPNTFIKWKSRLEKGMLELESTVEEAVPADSVPSQISAPASTTSVDIEDAPESDERTEREEVIPTLVAAAGVSTRDEAGLDASVRMTTDLVQKFVWIVRSEDRFAFVIAKSKQEAGAVAIMSGMNSVVTITQPLVLDGVFGVGGIEEGKMTYPDSSYEGITVEEESPVLEPVE